MAGGDKIPATGGVLLVSNHVSFLDPISETAFVFAHGRVPRYLAKASLWDLPVIGNVLADGGHVPVHRDAAAPLGADTGALAALCDGEAVVIYPEGNLHRRSGRPADAGQDRCGQDGAGDRSARGAGRDLGRSPRPAQGKDRAAPAAPHDGSHGGQHAGGSDAVRRREPTPAVLRAATAHIMAAITQLLAEIRG
jgi:1-acyl-sn-glycerol-3-phosphate acyltransferase